MMPDSFDEPRSAGPRPREDCLAAILGERVPEKIYATTKLCLVRGIRYKDGFAGELSGIPELPEITRALNARAIMSNRVPEMKSPEEFPYCFWHPDVPSEETLRELLRQYPACSLLPYQVGRACAVGGYIELYHELGLLPDVTIAEEARDNHKSGQLIYQAIMEAPVRYAYMDDYKCCLRENPIAGAHLNGDTCVRSMLDKRFPLGHTIVPMFPKGVFDITEDQRIDIEGMHPGDRPVCPETVKLLYSPLPDDLPSVDKDLLILMAAWDGNIDRYNRLRRPRLIDGEIPCIVRGIYHHPFFAKWWLTQSYGLESGYGGVVRKAVYARCIMNNDISWLKATIPDSQLPIMIWYPQVASPETYVELARREPRMASLAARACIHADYQKAFDQVSWEPCAEMWVDALDVPSTHYLTCIEAKAAAVGVLDCEEEFLGDLEDNFRWEDQWYMVLLEQECGPIHSDGSQSSTLVSELRVNNIGFESERMQNFTTEVGRVLLHACVANESIRPTKGALQLCDLYREGGRKTTA